ncbi:MAG: type II secretion system F family protein [Actinobacteria bacterium]|nr:type II secretion system F family protein [Actinomycetota bacterium]
MKVKFTIAVIVFAAVILISFAGFPLLAFCQENEENTSEETILSSSGEIIIKNIDTAGFPNISLYLGFNEGSKLGLLNLEKDDLKITENNKEIKDVNIEKIGETDEKVGVVLAIDTSGSMKGDPIENAKSAAAAFIEEMRQTDSTSIIGFSDNGEVFSTFTNEKNLLSSSLDFLEANGETALFDGILKGLEQFETADDLKHRYLIVLSDGTDTVSTGSSEDVIKSAKYLGVTVYSIALMSNEFNPTDIENIALNTGGELLMTSDSSMLKSLYSGISQKIRNQYKISFTSVSGNTGAFNASLFIEKLGLKDSLQFSYESPFSTLSGKNEKGEGSSGLTAELMVIDKWWIKALIYVLIFVSVTIFIYIVSTIMVPNKQDLKTRTYNYLYNISGMENPENGQENKKQKRLFFGLFNNKSSSVKNGFSELFEQKLKKAGLSISGSKFVFIHLASVAVFTLAVFLITRNILVTFCVVILIIFMPFLFINFKIGQKLKKFNEQLPDTLQLIEGALKAGYSLNQSLSMVVKETKPPISEEFTITLNEIRMGLDEKTALENMAKRINSELFDWVVLAVNIQREVGGNLAEIMDIISNTIREKERILRQIKSLTAEGKLSAYVLIGLPIVLGIALSILNREYINVLFTTKIGFLMLFLAALLMLGGVVWIMRIIKIDY